MRTAAPLSPLGTARAAITSVQPADTAEAALLAWLAPVRERLVTAFAVEDEIALLAWELARWPAGLDLDDRAALTLLALSAMLALRQGSTRLPLRGTEGRAFRLDLARRLLGDAPEPGRDDGISVDLTPDETVDRALALVDSGRAGMLVGAPGEFKPLIDRGEYLYIQKMLRLEECFAESLLGRMDEGSAGWSEAAAERAVADVSERSPTRGGRPVRLSADQLAAVRAAARFRLLVVSGGPGTGKTTIVVSILRALRRLGVACDDMVLAAPTGKAAHRLGEAVRSGLEDIANPSPEDHELAGLADPQTLHRLLGYSPRTGRFLHHENNRLAGRLFVVDEASMIDLALMERFVRSLRDDARLILLGDDRQLPSVEAGAVLRDLIGGGDGSEGGSPLGPRAVRLTESHRMSSDNRDGRQVLTVSRAIERGECPPLVSERTDDATIVERPSPAEVAFQGVEFVAAAEGTTVVSEFLDRWFAEFVRGGPEIDRLIARPYTRHRDGFSPEDREALGQLFAHVDRTRILCLTRVRPTGSDRINAALHRRALEARRANESLGQVRDDDLIAGEPVMMQVNDYGRMIFNGDQGIVLRVADGARTAPMVVFPRDGNYVAFRIDALRPVLLHAYALTVHKAQGSEYDRVALILPEVDVAINSREILYTALTRSRRAVTVVGPHEVFAQGVARRIQRSSGLAAMLRDTR
jgi:exodeoxyribonuclease V alpha subunit